MNKTNKSKASKSQTSPETETKIFKNKFHPNEAEFSSQISLKL
jgi:hypothetical protein